MTQADILFSKLVDILAKEGYVRRGENPCNWQATFHKPERTVTHYYGTYLNPFSCLDYDDEPGKVYLWSDSIAREEPTIFLQTVYKHNAAKENVSVDLFVIHNHITETYSLPLSKHDTENQIFMRELAKSPKPILQTTSATTKGTTVLKIRFRPTDSDKKIANAFKKIAAAFDSFVPQERNDDLNPSDFPKDTTYAHFQWTNDWKARHQRT